MNVVSTYALARHFSDVLSLRGKGGILFVSSVSAHMPTPYASNYSGSKAYVLNFGLSLHWVMKRNGVDVTVLSPGYTTTPMSAEFDKDRVLPKNPFPVMTPEAVAKEAIDALGKKAVIIPGKKNRFMMAVVRRLVSAEKSIAMGGKMFEKVYGLN